MRPLLLTAIILAPALVACCTPEEPAVEALLRSPSATDVIRGVYAIGVARDTSQVPYLLSDPNDVRISHSAQFLGISVYQAKMGALKKISGLAPPRPIGYRPDSGVVAFYHRWAVAHGFKVGALSVVKAPFN